MSRAVPRRTRTEVCVDGVAGAVLAERLGADRVEVCADLAEGGLTPSIGTVAGILTRVATIGVQVLIRPRPGHFVFDDVETSVMLADITAVRALGHAAGVRVGFAVGALLADSTIDVDTMRQLTGAAGDAPTTFHRAFDLTPDLRSSLRILADLGIGRVLTSGGAVTAVAGAAVLADLVAASAGRVTVLAGGGIRPGNVRGLIDASGVHEVHFAAGRIVPGRATTLPGRPSMTGTPVGVGAAAVPDEAVIAGVLSALAGWAP